MRRRPILLAIVVGAVLSASAVWAHQALTVTDEIIVDDPDLSHAVYGTFETGAEVFVIKMTFPEPFVLPFEILVEHRGNLENHRPNYAVVGPGLPAPTQQELDILPRALPPGAGVFLERHDVVEREVVFESVMRRTYWSSGPVGLPLLAGDHEIWVFSPSGTKGDFAMGFGVEEDFSDFGCGEITDNWSTYAY